MNGNIRLASFYVFCFVYEFIFYFFIIESILMFHISKQAEREKKIDKL